MFKGVFPKSRFIGVRILETIDGNRYISAGVHITSSNKGYVARNHIGILRSETESQNGDIGILRFLTASQNRDIGILRFETESQNRDIGISRFETEPPPCFPDSFVYH
jgi:hypothetical protein